MRRHFSFTTVAATVALFLSMTGASIAATRYLITSSRQIKPGVIALRDLSRQLGVRSKANFVCQARREFKDSPVFRANRAPSSRIPSAVTAPVWCSPASLLQSLT